jgi:hypothetical protein
VAVDLGALAAHGTQEMSERASVIAALAVYHTRLKVQGRLLKTQAGGLAPVCSISGRLSPLF